MTQQIIGMTDMQEGQVYTIHHNDAGNLAITTGQLVHKAGSNDPFPILLSLKVRTDEQDITIDSARVTIVYTV